MSAISQSETRSAPLPSLRKRARRMVGWFVLFAATAAIAVALLTVLIDPLQFYHRAGWYTPRFSTEERYQNPGLAKNWDYDTIIIGTSMTENFLPSQVGEQLGGKVMKLSIEGSTADEHNKIAKVALSTGKVKRVLWGLDYFSLKSNSADDGYNFPDYLYDDKWWNDYPYLFNYSVYQQFFNSIKANLQHLKPQNLEYLYNWNHAVTYGKAKVAKSYAQANVDEVYFGLNEETLDVVQQSFDDNILSLVKAYPDVEFDFYYPPYSVLRQVVWYNTNPGRFGNQLEMRKWMYEQFASLPNVKLYDFQANSEWTYDLDLYKDLSHHKQDVNSWIAEAIGADDAKYRVTDGNVDSLNAQLKQQAETAVLNADDNVVGFQVMLNGESKVFTNRVLADTKDELLVPVKQAAAALGADLGWDQATKTVTLSVNGRKLKMTVGSTEAQASGSAVTSANAPQLVGGTALIPFGFAAGQLGFNVAVDHSNGQMTVLTVQS
ncbi:copper amine oxidase N-terminal domain-containing protein [Cohnella zeiphila]|uniref:Copper amine oxidase N-terminal domain-containing protein n=1 Tax=Cohnella zeiphila TaxID=2761120 RepID=A0A7X0SRY8_9BACL|nr:copper amine oxidase N-terminal domain-containing protein [Cohnella zeiphila]MBB6735047.1 copper amine oxidase N-terminal domain-containing protein [Cohnella zeiphila]